MEPRDRDRRPGGDRRHRVGMRGDDQRLRLPLARRSRLRFKGFARRRAGEETSASIFARLDLAFPQPKTLVVAYHVRLHPAARPEDPRGAKALLSRAGFTVRSPTEAHICCGSAGTYNILHPQMAAALRERKVAHLARLRPDVIAAGNIGCLAQIASATSTPVVHTVELLDWASGGPAPAGLG